MIWIKHHLAPFYLWLTGFTFTLVIDWEHIFSKIVETSILAFFNGVLAAVGGGLYIWGRKKIKAYFAKVEYLNALKK